MALAKADLKQVVDHVRANLYDMLVEMAPRFSPELLTLHQDMVRLQEELKSQRELMAAGFAAVDKRFEDLIAQTDKRFEDLIAQMDRRFEAVDRRFEDVDKRFEDMNRRFEDMNQRFADTHKRLSGLQWMVIVGFAMMGTLVSVFGFLSMS